jgi:YHS domain-containing protein
MGIQRMPWALASIVLLLACSMAIAGEKVFDPVCEQKVDKDKAIQAEYDGKIYCFCCEDCFSRFEKDPDKFACPCPPGSKDCPHCQGKSAKCPCTLEEHSKEHKGHEHHPGHGH